MPSRFLPPIESATQLREVLKTDLGYCTCAAGDAVLLLRDLLRYAKLRSDSLNDLETFKQASHDLASRLQLASVPGLASWFVYSLDRADLIYHNYNVTDIWITEKGREVLEALERFPNPAMLEDTEENGGDSNPS
jgi:hypothetical protein